MFRLFLTLLLFVQVSFLFAQTTYTAQTDGNWSAGGTWTPAGPPTAIDNVIIPDGFTVTLTDDRTINDITIDQGGTLNTDNGDQLNINGDLTLNGTIFSREAGNLVTYSVRMQGAGSTLDGTGTFTTSFDQNDDDEALFIFGADVTIAASADLTIENLDPSNSKAVAINAGVTVTNLGSISISPDLLGIAGTSAWVNGTDASLTVFGELLTTGLLTASATGNTVSYQSINAESVKDTEGAGNPYYNLIVGGSNIKTLTNDVEVNDLTITSILSTNNFQLTVTGDWVNNGDFVEGTSEVIFTDGSDNSHSIQGLDTESFYDLTIASGNSLLQASDVIVSNQLTLNNLSTISSGSNLITLGTSTASIGSFSQTGNGRIIGPIKRWVNATATDFVFPVGGETDYNPVSINFNNLSAGSLIVAFREEFPGIIGSSIDDNGFDVNNTFPEGFWTIEDADGLITTSFDLDLTGNGFTAFTIDSDTRILSRPSNTTTWTTNGAHSTVGFTTPTVQRTVVSQIPGEFTLGVNSDCTVPSTGNIVGDTDVCQSDVDNYSVSGTSNSTFSWEVVGGTITGGTGSGTSADPAVRSGVDLTNIDVTWSIEGNGFVRVVENNIGSIEGNPCGEGEPVEVAVQVNPVQTSAISGSTSAVSGSSSNVYAVEESTSYTYAWSVTPSTNVVINGNGNASVTIDWVDGSDAAIGVYTIQVIATSPGCGDANPETLDVTINDVFRSTQDGNWNLGATWGNPGNNTAGSGYPGITNNAIITNQVTVSEDQQVHNLILESSGRLIAQNADQLDIYGDFKMDGIVESQEAGNAITASIFMNGSGATLDGTGSFITTANQQDNDIGLFVFNANTTIAATANLTLTNSDPSNNKMVEVGNNVVVTNLGSITISPDLLGGNANSRWINGTNATLAVAANLFIANGQLVANATGNEVSYNGDGAQTIKDPSGSTYYNLGIDGTNTKTLTVPTTIAGNLSINSILSPAGNDIQIQGNWTNAGTFNQGTTTVIFNGTSSQTISSVTPVVFYNLTGRKSGSTLTISDNDVQVTNTLTLDNIIVNIPNDKLIIGESTSSVGSLVRTKPARVAGRVERYIDATATNFVFPVGTSSSDQTITLNFSNLNSGSVIAEFIASSPGSLSSPPLIDDGFDVNNIFNEGYWVLTTANSLTSNDFNVNVEANGFNSFTLDEDSRLIARESSLSPWITSGSHVDNAATFISPIVKRENVTVLSGEYAIAVNDDCVVPATSSIVGDLDVCTADVLNYTVSGTNNSTFSWEVVGGTITSGSGSGTSLDPSTRSGQNLTTIEVTWTTGGHGSVAVVEDNTGSDETNPCGEGDRQEVAITVNPIPTSAITGNLTPITGSTNISYTVQANTGYSYAWSVTPSTNVVINNDGNPSITIDWTDGGSDAAVGDYTIQVVATAPNSCGDAAAVTLDVSLRDAFQTVQDGQWDQGATWGNVGNTVGVHYPGINDNAIISHSVTMDDPESVNDLIIDAAGVLITQNADLLTVGRNLTIDGVIESQESGNAITPSVVMTGSDGTLDGSGSFITTANQQDNDEALFIFQANTTIAATADLSFINSDPSNNKMIEVDNNVVVTNLGSIQISPDLLGGNANSTWINGENSTLSVSDNLFVANGILEATATDNTVSYNGEGTQNIKIPSADEYYNLSISGSNSKTLQSETNITGTLSITSTLDPGGNNLTIQGNYDNQGSFLSSGITLLFTGNADQSFVSSTDEIFDNLTIDKTGGTITSSSNIQVNDVLTLTGGNINMRDNVLLLGSSTTAGQEGNLTFTEPATVIGQFSRFINSNQPSFVFPVGSSENLNTAEITFNDAPTGTLTIEFINSNPGSDGLPLNDNGTTVFNNFFEGYWALRTGNGLSSSDYDIELLLNGFASFNTSTARVLTRPNASANWGTDGSHIDVSSNVASRLNISTLGAELGLVDITNCLVSTTNQITSSSSDVCFNEPDVTYTAVGGLQESTYTWEVVGGLIDDGAATGTGTIADPSTVSGLGSGGFDDILVDWGSEGQIGSVTVVEDNNFDPVFGCGPGEPVVLNVNINPLPTSAISGSTAVSRSQSTPYSVTETTGYTYNWTLSGGATFSSTGTTSIIGGSNSVIVDWGTVSGTYTLSVVGVPPGGCSNAATVSIEVTLVDAFQTVQDGQWDRGVTWGNGGNTEGVDYPSSTTNAVVSHAVLVDEIEEVNNLIIDANGTLTIQNADRMIINGDFTLNGVVDSEESGNAITESIRMEGGGAILDGTGSFITSGNQQDNDEALFIIDANISIASTANLTFVNSDPSNNKMIRLDNNVIVTNFGDISISPDLLGNDGATWINESGGQLAVAANLLSNTNATLDASTPGNIVTYNGNDAQNIKIPQTTYSQLAIAGSSTKTMPAALTVEERLEISSTLLTANFDLTITGDWINSGSYGDGTSTTIFSGSIDQSIINTVGETFNSLTLDKADGILELGNNITVVNTLTMIQGEIDATSGSITLGQDAATEGILNYTTGQVVGTFNRFVDDDEALSTFVFPVGISGTPRLATLNFDDITVGGLISAEFVSSNPGSDGIPFTDGLYDINNTFNEGYWGISSPAPNDIAFTTYDLEVDGNEFTSLTINTDTRLISRTNSSSNWVGNGTHVGGDGVSTAQRAGLNSINLEFSLGSDDTCEPPNTSPIVSDDDTPCINGTTTYSVTNTVGSTYAWTVTGGTIINGEGTNAITVLWGGTGGTYVVEVIEDNSDVSGITGCGEGATVQLSVELNPLPFNTISGRTSVAEGSSGVLYQVDLLSNDYFYDWTVVGGTIDGGGDGLNSNTVTVSWPTVGTGSVSVEATFDCDEDGFDGDDDVSTPSQAIVVDIFPVIISNNGVVNGNWNTGANWVGGVAPQASNSARITGGSTFTTNNGDRTIVNLEIESGCSVSITDGETLTVTGDLTLDGTIISLEAGNTVDNSLNLAGDGAIIDGSGSVITAGAANDDDNPTTLISGNVTFASTSNLTFANNDPDNDRTLGVAADIIVRNEGSVTVTPDLEGGNNSIWINEPTGTVSVTDNFFTNANSVLNASQAGNTVIYNGTGAQSIKTPASNQYANLTVNTSGQKSFVGPVEVQGNLLIDGAAELLFNGNNITLGGDLTNNSTITTGGNTLTLNGASDQTFNTAESLPILTLDKLGSLVLGAALEVTGTLNMLQGNIDASAHAITVGDITPESQGTLNYTSGSVLGQFGRVITSTGSFLFPLGSGAITSRPIQLDINNLNATTGLLTGEFVAVDPGNTGVPIADAPATVQTVFAEGTWSFATASLTPSDFDVTLTATDFTSFEFDASGNNRVVYRNGGNWTVVGTHQTSSGVTVERTGLNASVDADLDGAEFGVGGIVACEGYDALVITGAVEVCTGDLTSIYSTSGIDGSDYFWTVVGGTIDEAGGANTYNDVAPAGGNSSITVTWGGTGTDGASVAVQETNSFCTGSGVESTVDVVINPIQLTVADVTGSLAVLEGSFEDYSVLNRSNYAYSWSTGDGTFVGGNTGNSVSVNWGTGLGGSATLTLTIDYTGGLGCTPAQQILNIPIVAGNDFVADLVAGNWSNPSTWVGNTVPPANANVTIPAGATVTLDISSVTVGDFVIEENGVFNNADRTITVNGDYTLNGVHSGASGTTNLVGGGTINGILDASTNTLGSGVTLLVSDAYTIDASAELSIEGIVFINSDVSLSNEGDIDITASGSIVGASSSTSVWRNNTNAALTVSGSFSTGRINASASTNTVTFDGASAQAIPATSGSPGFQSLTLSGSNTKSLTANANINALTIGVGTTLATGSNQLSISGTVTNNGTLDGSGGTINFSGTTRTIGGTTIFDDLNIQMDNASQNLTLNPSGGVSGDLAVLSGILTLGVSASESLNNVRIASGADFDITNVTNLNIAGNLTFESSADLISNSANPIIFNGTSQQIIGSITIGTLRKDNGGALTIADGNTTVSTSLQLTDGLIGTSSTNLLIVADDAGLTGGSSTSYVNGPLRKLGDDDFTFPVGDGAVYAPVVLSSIASSDPTDAFTVEYLFAGAPNFSSLGPGIIRVSGIEYWDIERSNGSGEPIIELTWDDALRESEITELSSLLLAHFNGSIWEIVAATPSGTPNAGSIASDLVFNNFSPFTFAASTLSSNPLPVELLSFEGSLADNKVILNWSTASEINNEGFEIQRSNGQDDFVTIGYVEGNGTTKETKYYDFLDEQPLFGYNYYRLKQVDFNGDFEYSNIIYVFNDFIREGLETLVYPNPAISEEVKIRVLTGDNHTPIMASVFDLSGKLVQKISIQNPTLTENFIRPSGLIEGSYLVIISQGGMIAKERLIVK